MENRYKLPLGAQRKYLQEVEKVSGFRDDDLAQVLGIVGRSFRDWRREKYPITQKAVDIIEKRYGVVFPFSKENALNNWKRSKAEAAR